MSNHITRLRTALSATLFLSTLVVASTTCADAPPNIVVILVDDMGWSDIGCYGSEIATPRIDALAERGVRFSQFYNTGRCSPTRASLLTGHYPHQAGMGHLDSRVVAGHPGFQGRIADTSVTLAEVLADAGYFTAMTGKWHLGLQHGTPPWKCGFQRCLNLQAGGLHFSHQTGSKGGAKLYRDGQEVEREAPEFGRWYGAYFWSEQGLKFADEAISDDKPFLLYVAHCAPHFPLMAPQELIDKHRGRYLVGWDKLREERYQRQIELGLIDARWPLTEREENSPAWKSRNKKQRERFDHMMAIYAAMIEAVDQSVGTIVDGLAERGVLDDTIILFLSDNGGNAESGPDGRYQGDNPGDAHSNVFLGKNWATLNNTPFRKFKHFVHEGGSATPLIVHWPAGIDASRHGSIVHHPAHVIDIMATAVAAAGTKFPASHGGFAIEPTTGVNLLPSLAGNPIERSEPLFFNHEDNRAVRDGRWKIVALKNHPWELYDMIADRSESNDLSQEYPERVAAMADQYNEWAKRTHVVAP